MLILSLVLILAYLLYLLWPVPDYILFTREFFKNNPDGYLWFFPVQGNDTVCHMFSKGEYIGEVYFPENYTGPIAKYFINSLDGDYIYKKTGYYYEKDFTVKTKNTFGN